MALPATDNFNRANGGLGANWAIIAGNAQIVSNVVQTEFVGTDSSSRWNTDTFANDQYAQITAVAAVTGTTRLVGALLRGSAVATTFYACSARGPLGASATAEIRKNIAGSTTVLSSGTATIAANDLVKGTVIGTTIALLINGVSNRSTTDSAIASGSAGLFVFVDTGAETDAKIDNWEGGNVAAVTDTGEWRGCAPAAKRMTWPSAMY